MDGLICNAKTLIVKSNQFWVGQIMDERTHMDMCHISESLKLALGFVLSKRPSISHFPFLSPSLLPIPCFLSPPPSLSHYLHSLPFSIQGNKAV